ncbi:MAG TPA: transporter substrate-binding domain-containing protein [Xanthobacteraceae bacterium]
MDRSRTGGWIGVLAIAAALGMVSTKPSAQSLGSVEQIAPTGRLRAALVKLPFLAKPDRANGRLTGVAPELVEEFAQRLGVPLEPLAFDAPNAAIAALREGAADIAILAPTRERAAVIDFGPPLMDMEMTLMVPGASPITSLAQADERGRRIVVYERTAAEEALKKKMTKVTVVRVPLFASKRAFALIKAGKADAFAGLRAVLVADQPELPGARILPGSFGSSALAIGYAKDRAATAVFVKDFTRSVTASGFVAGAIEKAALQGVTVPGE